MINIIGKKVTVYSHGTESVEHGTCLAYNGHDKITVEVHDELGLAYTAIFTSLDMTIRFYE